MTTRDRRPAFALPLALVALALIGALAAGAALAVTRDARAGGDALLGPRALDAADAALARTAWQSWDRTRNVATPVGVTLAPDTIAGPGGALAIVRATRLDTATWWLAAESSAPTATPGLLARRRTSLLARLAIPDVVVAAALTTRADVALSGTARVAGTDSASGAWSSVCPPASGGVAGVATPDPALVCDGACGATPSRIVGAPPILADSTAGDTTRYATFGGESWATLVARADVTLPGGAYRPRPSLIAGACDASDPLDWGDPARAGPCADRYPVVHIAGDLTALPGGAGQGVLLVDGTVRLVGGFTFAGLVIARDDLVATGTGNVLLGAVLAGDALAGGHGAIGGDTRIAYSRCAIDRALTGSASLRPARERAWSPLF